MITDNDPAGMAIAFTNAINRYSDHSCRLISMTERYGFNFEKDIHIPDIENDDFYEVEHLLQNADIFHFHMLKDENSHVGSYVIRDFIKGKKIIHHHHGHPDYLINADVYNEKYKKLNRKVIVSTPDLLKVANNSIWVPNLVPLYDVKFQPRYDRFLPGDVIRICQSPTRKFDKHTKEFNEVMARIGKKYKHIEKIIIEKQPYHECLNIKRTCHIIFDHMRGWFGIASLESLCHGKPVIAGLDEWNIKCLKEFTGADKLPWVIAGNKEELEKEIEKLILDKDLREQLGRQSRQFMETCWTERHALEILLDVYKDL